MARICFVSYEIAPTTPGGCGVLLASAARVLLERGHEVVFLLDLPSHDFRRFRDHDRLALPSAERCRAYRVEELADTGALREADFRDIFAWKSLLFERAARRLVELERPDVVEFFDYCGVGWASLCSKLGGLAFRDTHLAVRLHTSMEVLDAEEPTRPHGPDRYGLFALEHAALATAESILFPTRSFLEEAYRPRYGAWPASLHESPPPLVRVPALRPAESGADVVLFFGRLFTLKGADLFVDAAVSLVAGGRGGGLRFVLAGYDPGESPAPGKGYAEFLRGRIPAALAGRFEFPGQLSWAALEELSPRVLFAVFPSRFESFCYAARELSAAGLPVVLTDLPAYRDQFVDGGNALLVPPTVPAIAGAMDRLASEPGLRASLAAAGLRTAGESAKRLPLGEFYDLHEHPSWMDAPRATEPTDAAEAADEAGDLLCCVLDEGGGGLPATLASLEASRKGGPALRVVVLSTAGADEAAARDRVERAGTADRPDRPDGPVVWLLGRPWRARAAGGEPAARTESGTSLLVLREGDLVDPRFPAIAVSALSRHGALGWVGAFRRARRGGAERIDTFGRDLMPEVVPFGGASPLGRVVLRTEAGRPLAGIFDERAGCLGETALLWGLEDAGLRGLTLPEVLLTVAEDGDPVPSAAEVSYLVVRDRSPVRASRLARLLAAQSALSPPAFHAAAGTPPTLRRRAVQALSRMGPLGRGLLGRVRRRRGPGA